MCGVKCARGCRTEGSVVAVAETRQHRFEHLVDEVADPIRRYALRRTDPDTADDVLADTLLVVWRRLDEIPPDGHLPWCYAVAKKSLANLNRGARRQRNLVARIVRLDPPTDVVDAPEVPDAAVQRALAGLTPNDQELLRLSAWEDLTPSEIATVLGLTPNAVRIRLHRARGRFVDALERETPNQVPDRQ
jgi:RNA polymerase sigma-70 factor (ECF subfamily)